MSMFSRRPGAALLAGLAGLGLALTLTGPGAAHAASPFVNEPPAAAEAGPQDLQAVAVSVQRTRGLNNISTFQIAGLNSTSEVLRIASSPAFRALAPRYVPVSKSGRYRYEVTVQYRNGTKKRVVTYSKTPGMPPVLLELLKKTMAVKVPVVKFPPGFPFN
ncbi:MAG TPA: hypothetical protein VN408_38145 [Actinoplanes sp.]|nr:hypothetical protein [Actinoplanes sp.]